MKILFITNNLPYPLNIGEKLRNYNLLKRIGEKHELYLLVTSTNSEDVDNVKYVEDFCVKVEVFIRPDYHALSKPIDWFKYLLAGIPPDLRLLYSPEMAEKMREWVTGIDFDIINIDHSYMAFYWYVLEKITNAKTILTLHDVLSVNYRRLYPMEKKIFRKLRLWLHSTMLQSWEPEIAGKFDHIFTVSEDEKSLLLETNPNMRIDVVYNGVDTKLCLPLPEDEKSLKLLFVGDMDYLPNVDAVKFFVKEVFPLIRKKIENVEFWIVGMSPAQEVLDLQGDGVIVTGRVESVVPYYEQSKVCVVPLRAGSGTRLKIVEAMALTRPIVSTTIGAEGINVQDNVHIAIADTAEDFAERTIQLLTDEKIRMEMVKNAREFVEHNYEWDVIFDKMNSIWLSFQDDKSNDE